MNHSDRSEETEPVIKNERQYRTVVALAKKLESDIGRFDSADLDPIREAEREALMIHYEELRNDLREYEMLRSGEEGSFEVRSLEELPQVLVKARIASRLTQRDLARRLGLKEQQIQRYEATGYASASLSRVLEVANALGLSVESSLFAVSSHMSDPVISANLDRVGLPKGFVRERLTPYAAAGEECGGINYGTLVALNRVFQWTPADLLDLERLRLASASGGDLAFKLRQRAPNRLFNAYTTYACYLATALAQVAGSKASDSVPTDAGRITKAIIQAYGSLNFTSGLKYVWDLGVPVLPLRDPGVFHGACWRVNGNNVIILKQTSSSSSRWFFDLMHELWHAGREPELGERAVIESADDSQSRRVSFEEIAASHFAGDVLLSGRPEELVKRCIAEAQGKIEWLKNAVRKVSADENVDIGALSNYVAFRLSLQGENWWGSATNLQPRDDPWSIARDELVMRVDLTRLETGDRELLCRALACEMEV